MSVRMNIVLSDDLKKALDQVSAETEQSASETLRKALHLYLAARENTRSGERKLGFFDAKTRQVDGEVIGL
ncbi:ribbon-helix-helix protein, CopG family [Stenotrophomonas sp. 1337]|uniref:ribbon-helix-helix protein, CopG family n=1 Tax=Stenotrophomonas sp. 1337 TaxID=2817757 RepID=UPI002858D9A1|nr:ribbon-helix-helix protein, CopG family [Stenotrophomonas sp. 1337]MDR6696277.1 putative transcriptional regulator [Stenotrophomonas sp. 1337]